MPNLRHTRRPWYRASLRILGDRRRKRLYVENSEKCLFNSGPFYYTQIAREEPRGQLSILVVRNGHIINNNHCVRHNDMNMIVLSIHFFFCSARMWNGSKGRGRTSSFTVASCSFAKLGLATSSASSRHVCIA